MVDIDTIVPNPRNPNHHPDRQLELLAKIIRTQGWRNPIVISKRSGFVTKGHGRLAAAKLLGLTHVPVDFQEYDNEASEWADMVADNRIAELAEADDDALRDIINDLNGKIDLDLTGFADTDLEQLLHPAEEEQPPGTGDEPDLGDTTDINAENQYGVIVMCASESEQEQTYNALIEQGYKCKVVAV